MPVPIAHVMSRHIVTIDADEDLMAARSLFDRHHFHHLMVVDNGRLVGVISDRDLLRNLSPFIGQLSERQQDVRTLYKRVHRVMTSHPITVTADASISDVVRLMLDHEISCVPVVAMDARPVGIVTLRGMLRAMNESAAA